ncbi:hypothetical protein X777_09313, partial [Ooceraea biroi]
GLKPKLKQPLIAKSVNTFHRVVPNPILRKASRKRIVLARAVPLVEGDNGGVGGVGDWCSMGDERRSGDKRRGFDDRRGISDSRSGDQWALHGYLVGVGVAGGDRDGVGDRDRGRRDDRCRVKSSGCRQVAGCGRSAGQQGEENDELVHG